MFSSTIQQNITFPSISTTINGNYINAPKHLEFIYEDEFKRLNIDYSDNDDFTFIVTEPSDFINFFTRLNSEQKARDDGNTGNTIIIKLFTNDMNVFDSYMAENCFPVIDDVSKMVSMAPDITLISNVSNINLQKALQNANVVTTPFSDLPVGYYFILMPNNNWRVFAKYDQVNYD